MQTHLAAVFGIVALTLASAATPLAHAEDLSDSVKVEFLFVEPWLSQNATQAVAQVHYAVTNIGTRPLKRVIVECSGYDTAYLSGKATQATLDLAPGQKKQDKVLLVIIDGGGPGRPRRQIQPFASCKPIDIEE